MAILTEQERATMWRNIYRKGAAKDELKTLPSLPSTDQAKAIFQVFEDLWENNKAQVITDVNTAAGQTLPNSLIKKIGVAFLLWKAGKGG